MLAQSNLTWYVRLVQGYNYFGQLGDGNNWGRNTPGAVASGPAYTQISAGYHHTCGVAITTGHAWCFGWNSAGQLGDGSYVDKHTPVAVTVNTVFKQIAAGEEFTCGADVAGYAWCTVSYCMCWWLVLEAWRYGSRTPLTCMHNLMSLLMQGSNDRGQLGDGTTTSRPYPAAVQSVADFSWVSAGGSHTAGLRFQT